MEIEQLAPAPIRGAVAAFTGSRLGRILIGLAAEISADDVPGLAAETAYRFLFALFPFLIFLAALLGFIGARIGQEQLFTMLISFVAPVVPAEIQHVLNDWVAGVVHAQSGGLLTVGAAGALWGAAGGVGTLMKGLNRAYDVAENRPFLQAQALALGTTLLLAIFMVSGLALYAVGDWLGGRLASSLGLGAGFRTVWSILQGPGVAVGLWIVLLLLYRWLPNTNVKLRHAIPGALFAVVAWVAVTVGFSAYVTHFGSFDRTFGSLGAAVVLMFWMYAVGMILLIGGELNAILAGQKTQPLGVSAPANPERVGSTIRAA
ncbi:MAG: rane protein [Chloroflexota bacterium]|jgi:membrane protein|nr:rane protein [Chloroflexota bacterium]